MYYCCLRQAWNGAALHNGQICAICGVLKAFMVISNEKACAAFLSIVKSYTMQNCKGEMSALDMLNRQGIVRAIQPSIMMPVKRVLSKTAHNRASGHIPAKVRYKLFLKYVGYWMMKRDHCFFAGRERLNCNKLRLVLWICSLPSMPRITI